MFHYHNPVKIVETSKWSSVIKAFISKNNILNPLVVASSGNIKRLNLKKKIKLGLPRGVLALYTSQRRVKWSKIAKIRIFWVFLTFFRFPELPRGSKRPGTPPKWASGPDFSCTF